MTEIDQDGLKRAEAVRVRGVPTREVIEAYLAEPVWPTDQLMKAIWPAGGWGPNERDRLRAAMLADPIIQAAIALRDAFVSEYGVLPVKAVSDAVNDAGL